MFMPGYSPQKANPQSGPSWQKDKAMMKLIEQTRTRLTPEERTMNRESRKMANERRRLAEKMKAEGASVEAIKTMMLEGV